MWDSVEEEYQRNPTLVTKYQKLEFTCNANAMNALLVGLPKSKLVKVMDCKSSKEIWDKMRNFYEGDNKVKVINPPHCRKTCPAEGMVKDLS